MSGASPGPEGISLTEVDDRVVDVLFDGRRIWSFRPDRVAERTPSGWRVPWPRDLHGFLDGTAEVTLRSGPELLAGTEVRFGAGNGRVQVADDDGRPLVVDPGGRLVATFDSADPEQLRPLVDAVELVLAKLTEAGLDAFPAYGTLLGAVRGGRLIGHDNDADVAYLSRHAHPVDVIRESFRIQRLLHRDGLEITRYSGGAFKVTVRDEHGVGRGLDVFTGFLYRGRLVLMGELFTPFEESWLRPLGTVELEGRVLSAPAEPDRLLAAMYGPSWRVPDPTFTFDKDPAVQDRLNAWFRGTRTHRNGWDRRYSTSRHRGPVRRPHALARQLHEREPGSSVVDVGCGRGQDAVWLARQGHRVTGLDFSGNGFAHLRDLAGEKGWDVEFADANLLELRHTMLWAARLSRTPGPRAVLARHFLDATSPRGREHFWRLARAVLGGGGRAYVEFLVSPPRGPSPEYLDPLVWELDPDVVAAEAGAAGARVVSTDTVQAGPYERPGATVGDEPPYSCRMVMEWDG